MAAINGGLVNGSRSDLGELRLVERQAVSAVASVTFSGLDGDADNVYKVLFRVTGSAAQTFNLDPNALTTNQSTQRSQMLNSAISGVEDTRQTIVATPAGDVVHGEITYWADAARDRVGGNFAGSADDASSQTENEWSVLHWREATTNITSLVLSASTGTFTGTVALFKMVNAD